MSIDLLNIPSVKDQLRNRQFNVCNLVANISFSPPQLENSCWILNGGDLEEPSCW